MANFNYIKCSNCYTIYLSKKNFSNLKLEKFHELNWRKKNNFKFVKKPDHKKILSSWKHTCSKLKLNNNLSLLDIGCGDGSMLIALKEIGFQSLYGFDSDSKLINKLKKKYDINFFYDNFERFYKNKNISNLKFDYIFLNGVLEHSYDPSKLLEKTRKLATRKTEIFIKHPFIEGKKIPLFLANFVLMDYGSGAIFGCPAHDQRDLDFARKYKLKVIPVVLPNGEDEKNFKINKSAYTEEGTIINSKILNGLFL